MLVASSASAREPAAFVVLERGCRLPSRLRGAPVHRVLVAQAEAESAVELVARAKARLCDLEQRGARIDFAMLACNETTTSLADCRAKLANVLLEHLSPVRGARLVFAARGGGGVCAQLVALADRALAAMRTTSGHVSLWFGDDRMDR